MSELIDRIYDVEKISSEVNTILASLKTVEKQIQTLNDSAKDISLFARKAKDVDELSKAAKNLNDNFSQGSKSLKTWEDQVAALKAKTEQLTTSEKQASIEIAKARLELQAAQKATKEAAIAEIELTGKNKDLAGSYNALQKDLKNAIASYKALSGEEANSAKGKELLNKIGETQAALKKSDAAMGNYQRNVGNYSSALEGLTPKLGGFAGTLLNIARNAKKAQDDLNEMGGDNGLGIMAQPRIPAGLAKIMTGFRGIGQTVVAMGKAVIANPIVAVLAAIVFVVSQVKKAFEESEERSNKLSEAFARMKPIMRTIGDIFEVIADGFIKFVEITGKAIAVVTEFLGINPKGSADKFVEAEKMKQQAVINTRIASEKSSKLEAEIETQRAIIADKESYSFEQRMQALKKAEQLEKQLAATKTEIARQNLKAILAENALDDNNAEANQRKTDAVVAFNKVKQEQAQLSRKLAKDEQKLIKENEADLKAQADEAKAAADKIIAARRRLVDSSFALMKDSEEKQLKINAETYSRQIEDLQRNGELTKQLKSNLLKEQQIEADKITNEWNAKKLNDSIKSDELILSNMQKAGDDTLLFEKQLLNKRKEAEILAGADRFETEQKYQYLSIDLEAQTADKKAQLFEKAVKRDAELITKKYSEQEIILKKQYSLGLISADDYEKSLNKIKLDGLLELNNKSIEALKKELEISGLSADKKAELSKQLTDLQITNENAVTDSVIKNNEDRVKADKDAIAKRVEIANALGQSTTEIFGAIADFEKQQSEQKIAQYEKEQEASDKSFEQQQSNLDNALMSDENRAAKQKELTEKKAASDKVIADKIKAEKIKQAKWDKANNLIQAIMTAGLAILNASLTQPFIPLGLIAAGTAATMGAIQVATIASQQIPAYEKGTDNHPGGLSLWGEKRPEVAVTPSGDTFLADTPTLTNFEAGSVIYKSVSDYENRMAKQSFNQMVFDYDKFGEKMPKFGLEFDANGMLIVRDKQNNRRTIMNRKYKV